MLRTNIRCVESLNISVEVAKCGKYSQIHPVHSHFIYYKKWPVLTEQSIRGNFQLISMSSYAKNKQEMCQVEDRRQVTERQLITIQVKYEALEKSHSTLKQQQKKMKVRSY